MEGSGAALPLQAAHVQEHTVAGMRGFPLSRATLFLHLAEATSHHDLPLVYLPAATSVPTSSRKGFAEARQPSAVLTGCKDLVSLQSALHKDRLSNKGRNKRRGHSTMTKGQT